MESIPPEQTLRLRYLDRNQGLQHNKIINNPEIEKIINAFQVNPKNLKRLFSNAP